MRMVRGGEKTQKRGEGRVRVRVRVQRAWMTVERDAWRGYSSHASPLCGGSGSRCGDVARRVAVRVRSRTKILPRIRPRADAKLIILKPLFNLTVSLISPAAVLAFGEVAASMVGVCEGIVSTAGVGEWQRAQRASVGGSERSECL